MASLRSPFHECLSVCCRCGNTWGTHQDGGALPGARFSQEVVLLWKATDCFLASDLTETGTGGRVQGPSFC